MSVRISGYNASCNIGANIDEIYSNAIQGNDNCFVTSNDIMPNKTVRIATINFMLPNISDEKFNIRCNRLILHSFDLLKKEINKLKRKYAPFEIGVIVATTNSGVSEYETTHNIAHSELGNPALFIKETLGLSSFYTTVSTACSSGIKAFSLAKDLIDNNVVKATIVVGVDSIAKVPLYGFTALDVLSGLKSNSFSLNRTGINIGEAVATFIVEKDVPQGIQILGIGENSDTYHLTTPDPNGIEATNAIKIALKNAQIQPNDIDYINLHGTGTFANDKMEATAINTVFPNTPASSTKLLTGHCLGAAASIEIALCCALLDKFNGKLYPHIYDDCYDYNLPKINLVDNNCNYYKKCNICLCNSFGFGGTNAIIVLGKNNE